MVNHNSETIPALMMFGWFERLSDSAAGILVKIGGVSFFYYVVFDPLMGARPMSRLIQDTIRRALADELLFGRLSSGGKVTVDMDAGGKVKLEFPEQEPADIET